jgi:hypothetical protein
MISENKIEFKLEYDSNTLYNFNGHKNMDELVLENIEQPKKNK